MTATQTLFFVTLILATGISTVVESAACSQGGGSCNGCYSVCCNAINPGNCCPTGYICCGKAVNYGCCPSGYTCELTRCTKRLRDGNGPASIQKTGELRGR